MEKENERIKYINDKKAIQGEVSFVKKDVTIWSNFFKVKDDVYKALETARNEKIIGSGLEANVYLNLPEAFNNVKDVLGDVMHQLLIVSKVVFTSDELTKYDKSTLINDVLINKDYVNCLLELAIGPDNAFKLSCKSRIKSA